MKVIISLPVGPIIDFKLFVGNNVSQPIRVTQSSPTMVAQHYCPWHLSDSPGHRVPGRTSTWKESRLPNTVCDINDFVINPFLNKHLTGVAQCFFKMPVLTPPKHLLFSSAGLAAATYDSLHLITTLSTS